MGAGAASQGDRAGDTLEGTTLGADGAALKWTGVRAPAPGPDTPVTWAAPVITGITGGALDSAEGTPGPLMLQATTGRCRSGRSR